MTVVENTFSAQYGHTSGGFITYTTKSGTDKFHGNLYNFYSSDSLDAGNFFFAGLVKNKKLPLTQDNWGAAVGGPVPKITKLAKTFWFFNVDGLDYHSTVNTGFVNTLPTPLQRQGNFSEFLGSQVMQTCPTGTANAGKTYGLTDLLGNPMLQGQIYNPAPTSFVPVAAHTVTDPCTNNTVNVPAGLDRKSTRLNSSHGYISYAVFCLKKKKTNSQTTHQIPRQQAVTAVSSAHPFCASSLLL